MDQANNSFSVVRILGDYLALADDPLFPAAAVRIGSMDVDRFRDLPCVQKLGPKSVVIDVGAFIGDTALVFLERGATVYAFEPAFDSFVCLQWNLFPYLKAPESDRRAFIYNKPVGDGRRCVPIPPASDPLALTNPGARRQRITDDPQCGAQTCTIDSMEFNRLDFVKIDCEGFEPFVLDGMRDTIKKHRPVLCVEINEPCLAQNGFTIQMMIGKLIGLGYHPVLRDPNSRDWICHPG